MRRRERRPPPDGGSSGRAANGLLVVGRIGGPFGVKGWVRVTSFTEPADNLTRYRPWHLGRSGAFEPVHVEAIEPRGRHWVAKLAGVDSREAAERLVGSEVAVPESVLPATGADEYYWKDLIGLEVVTRDGRRIGRIERLLATGAHDVLVVTAEGHASRTELLIPFVAAIVAEVDVAGGRLVADWDVDDGASQAPGT